MRIPLHLPMISASSKAATAQTEPSETYEAVVK
jgi:hypothetical protein